MDILLMALGVIAGIFLLFIMMSDSLKMVEKVTGSVIFFIAAFACFSSVLMAGYFIEKQVYVIYNDSWDQVETKETHERRIEEYIPQCKVVFDVDLPFTAFYGKEYTKVFNTRCQSLSDEQNRLIAKMIENYR